MPEKTRKPNDFSVSPFKILRALLDGEKQSDIARRFNVTRAWVSLVKMKAISAGFDELTIHKNKHTQPGEQP